jgi:hypothetical protein
MLKMSGEVSVMLNVFIWYIKLKLCPALSRRTVSETSPASRDLSLLKNDAMSTSKS